MTLTEAVQERFYAVNGRHPLTAEDEAYVLEQFLVVGPGAAGPLGDGDYVLTEMLKGDLPLPGYLLPGGRLALYPNYVDIVDRHQSPGGLYGWFADGWDHTSGAPLLSEWQGFLSGQDVCLREVTPTNLVRKYVLVDKIRHALETRAKTDTTYVLTLVAELDALEPRFTDYDRLRFAGPTSRDVWIDDVRAQLNATA